MSSAEQASEQVFYLGDRVAVFDEHDNYIGFDGVIDMLREVRDGEEIYRVEMPNGEMLTLSETRLDYA